MTLNPLPCGHTHSALTQATIHRQVGDKHSHHPSTPTNMKRHSFTNSLRSITLVLGAIVLLHSCQKCETCSYRYTAGNGQQETYSFPEVCGDKDKREAQKHACETAAQLAGTTCTCVSN